MSDAESLCWIPAVELSRQIAVRDITPMEVADAVLRRIEKVNPVLNAFVLHDPEQVLRDARRLTEDLTKRTTLPPLYGIPYSVKKVAQSRQHRSPQESWPSRMWSQTATSRCPHG